MTASPRKSSFTRRAEPAAPPPAVHKNNGHAQRALSQGIQKRLKKNGGFNPAGRPKGSKDKIPRELRAAVLDAGHLAGYDVVVAELVEEELTFLEETDPEMAKKPATRKLIEKAVRKVAHGDMTDYLRHQAKANPSAFMSVLGKVLPKQIDMNVQLTSRQVLDEMTERRNVLADLRAEVLEAAKGIDYHAEEDD